MQRTIAKCGEGPAIPHTAPEKPMSQQANPALNALGLAARAAAADLHLVGIYDVSYASESEC